MIRHRARRHLSTFSLRMRRSGYLGAFTQKSDLTVRSGDLDFLLGGYISTIG